MMGSIYIHASDYNVTGILVPDSSGSYFYAGSFGGVSYARRADGAWFLWWDGVQSWNITSILGGACEFIWERESPDIEGLYIGAFPATGDATVRIGLSSNGILRGGRESVYRLPPNRIYHTNINSGIFGG